MHACQGSAFGNFAASKDEIKALGEYATTRKTEEQSWGKESPQGKQKLQVDNPSSSRGTQVSADTAKGTVGKSQALKSLLGIAPATMAAVKQSLGQIGSEDNGKTVAGKNAPGKEIEGEEMFLANFINMNTRSNNSGNSHRPSNNQNRLSVTDNPNSTGQVVESEKTDMQYKKVDLSKMFNKFASTVKCIDSLAVAQALRARA